MSESLCLSCRYARTVRGRRGQRYLLCRNEEVPAKYPRQPVQACPGYAQPAEGRIPRPRPS